MTEKTVNRRKVLGVLSGGMGASIAGCSEIMGGSGGNTITIGLPITTSGALGALGEAHLRGFEIGKEEINNNGGIDGKDIDIISQDVGNDPGEAVRTARDFAERPEVKLISGSVASGTTLAIAPEVTDLDIPYISAISQSTKITGQECNSHTFSIKSNTYMKAVAATRFMVEELGHDSFDVIALDIEFGHNMYESVQTVLQNIGMNPDDVITTTEWPSFTTSDYSTHINRMQGTDSDAVMCLLASAPTNTYLKQANNFGLLNEKVHVGEALTQVPRLKEFGDTIEGVYSPVDWVFTANQAESFTQNHLSDIMEHSGFGIAMAYATLQAYKAAVEKAGTTNTDDVVSALSGLQWNDSIRGDISMKECNHQATSPLSMVRATPTSEYSGPLNLETEVYPEVIQRYQGDSIMRDCSDLSCNLGS